MNNDDIAEEMSMVWLGNVTRMMCIGPKQAIQ